MDSPGTAAPMRSLIEQGLLKDTDRAAQYIGKSKQSLADDRHCKRWGIPFRKIGGRIFYHVKDLDAFVNGGS